MNAHKKLYKLFYQAERAVGSTRRTSGWKVLDFALDAIRVAYRYEHSQKVSLSDLFEAQAAANNVIMNKRKPDFSQSEKLAAALAKFRGVAL
ncbi:hypothetical protein [Photobacterium chitinilyticum]|uniref:Uncharacterized protein n=1 Tax=Photobacterium chitinilyticum TaxID=2485123 RepID=A0A3S3R8K8_9GAMM|nr:hypothetical protein [Photobacterium chitinilyticum]RWX54971.1 hypothetical protein EDI28_14625 [Photobacterium chitinilyticum]